MEGKAKEVQITVFLTDVMDFVYDGCFQRQKHQVCVEAGDLGALPLSLLSD